MTIFRKKIIYDIVLNFATGVQLFQFLCKGVTLVICLTVDSSRWLLVWHSWTYYLNCGKYNPPTFNLIQQSDEQQEHYRLLSVQKMLTGLIQTLQRQRYQERIYTQIYLNQFEGLSQTVHLSFQYCVAYNVFIRNSDCEMCNSSGLKVRNCLHCQQMVLQTGVRDSGPKGCTNQNCAVKEISKPSRKQQALGHTSRMTKWNWRTLEKGVYICVQFRCKYRRVSFYAIFFFCAISL